MEKLIKPAAVAVVAFITGYVTKTLLASRAAKKLAAKA
jgi:hypothetical protein